jgi:hypothetical protein
MDCPVDIDALRIPEGTVIRTPARSSPPRPRQRERFLKGPISWPWLERASSLPGKALHVAIRLWFEKGLAKSSGKVSISMTGMARMGVSRWAASRGLGGLEAAGLVSVVRHVGRKPVVTILAPPPTQGAELP